MRSLADGVNARYGLPIKGVAGAQFGVDAEQLVRFGTVGLKPALFDPAGG